MAICSRYNVLSNNAHPLTPYDTYITMECLSPLEDHPTFTCNPLNYFILLFISMIVCNIAVIISYATVYTAYKEIV